MKIPGWRGEAPPWLECLEEGILGLGERPFPSRIRKGEEESILGGRYEELQAGKFWVIFKISAQEGQVEIVMVRE